MSRTVTRPEPKTNVSPKPVAATSKESWRDTVEQIVVAFILAILIRAFDAEAFVIPTGSMAPTLMGHHKEVACPQCGFVYTVNAAEEPEGVRRKPPLRVDSSVCVNCRWTATGLAEQPSFKGDRILVSKFPFELPFLPGARPPERWDVVVFRYPEEPETNYIKRLVGLPGELLRIHYGDILTRAAEAEPFTIRRKPTAHQRAMQMNVNDDRHRPTALAQRPEWTRWKGEKGFSETSPGTFQAEEKADSELRYRHLIPDPDQWSELAAGQTPAKSPKASLITDFYSYNTGILAGSPRNWDSSWRQPHWVGDLTTSFDLKFDDPKGIVEVELIEGGVSNRCTIDLSDGIVSLSHGNATLGEPIDLDLKAGQTSRIEFANVDNRLTLWVNGSLPFGEGRTYDDEGKERPAPTAEDLSPVRIRVRGGMRAAVSGLAVSRDIYYTQVPGEVDYNGLWEGREPRNASDLIDILSDQTHFAWLGTLEPRDYKIGPDRFMMMGDNSPRSKDGRQWGTRDQLEEDQTNGWDPSIRESWEVPRSLLIGKAFFIYWPHGKPFGPEIRVGSDWRVPFRPYFERMTLIR
ncbi:S26 family signal peptidase [Isosphaeraceae bacterium EP7]